MRFWYQWNNSEIKFESKIMPLCNFVHPHRMKVIGAIIFNFLIQFGNKIFEQKMWKWPRIHVAHKRLDLDKVLSFIYLYSLTSACFKIYILLSRIYQLKFGFPRIAGLSDPFRCHYFCCLCIWKDLFGY